MNKTEKKRRNNTKYSLKWDENGNENEREKWTGIAWLVERCTIQNTYNAHTLRKIQVIHNSSIIGWTCNLVVVSAAASFIQNIIFMWERWVCMYFICLSFNLWTYTWKMYMEQQQQWQQHFPIITLLCNTVFVTQLVHKNWN